MRIIKEVKKEDSIHAIFKQHNIEISKQRKIAFRLLGEPLAIKQNDKFLFLLHASHFSKSGEKEYIKHCVGQGEEAFNYLVKVWREAQKNKDHPIPWVELIGCSTVATRAPYVYIELFPKVKLIFQPRFKITGIIFK